MQLYRFGQCRFEHRAPLFLIGGQAQTMRIKWRCFGVHAIVDIAHAEAHAQRTHLAVGANGHAVLLGKGQSRIVCLVVFGHAPLHVVAPQRREVQQQEVRTDLTRQPVLFLLVKRGIERQAIGGENRVDAGVIKILIGMCEVGGRDIAREHHINVRTQDPIIFRKQRRRAEFEIDFFRKMRFPCA